MPSIFDSHNLQSALKAAADGKPMSLDDARRVRDHANKIIDDAERANSTEARRAAKLQRTLEDRNMLPVVEQIKGSLRRLGLSIEEAANMGKLNSQLDARKWTVEERLRLKAMLHHTGISE